jgi:hypothetical protein
MGQNFNFANTPAQGTQVASGITAPTVVKAQGGRLMSVSVNIPGTALPAFSAYDSSTVAGTAASNLVYTSAVSTAITAGTQIVLDWPITSGIVIVPGTGSNVAAFYL